MLVGTHPSALPIETLNINDAVDFVARREYDYIVLKTAQALENNVAIDRVRGLTYRDVIGEIKETPDADYIEQLDDIPMAAPFIKNIWILEIMYFLPRHFRQFKSLQDAAARLTVIIAYIRKQRTAISIASKSGKCCGRI